MGMAFMKKDVNLGLLLLIVATLLLFSGFTVYYQTNFKNVVTEYHTKLEQLKRVTEELNTEKAKLNETYQSRIKAEKDVKALDQQYRILSEERDQLEKDKNKLQAELLTTKATLAEVEADLSQTKTQLSQTQAELASKEIRIKNLKEDIDALCAVISSLGGSDSRCD
jgi:chromosome segregation ATPase